MVTRIHIVEEDENDRFTAARALQALGEPIILHLNIPAFIKQLDDVRDTDVVVMDWRQPGLTCLDISRAIGSDSRRPYVVLWTALGPDELIPEGLVRERVLKGTGMAPLLGAVKKGLCREIELTELMDNLEAKPKGIPPRNGKGK